MSIPRPILQGQLHFITRRTSERRFFLRPSKQRNRDVEYCIAVAAERHGMQIHALVVMSNHWHCVATDPNGRIPAFLRDAHSWIAKVVNQKLGRWESLWCAGQTSLVAADGDENVLARVVYTMANPVEAGLVAHGRSWPGVRSCWPAERKACERPALFSAKGTMPAEAALVLVRPPGFEYFDDDALDAFLRDAIEQREQYHRDKMRIEGRKALGRRGVLAQSSLATPTSSAPRRNMSPRVAEKNTWRRVDALHRLGAFLDRYRVALTMWRAGFRDVVFPAGTYALKHNAGVRVAPG